jgi:RNA polymerase sigma-70 factor, ECF subfamily
VDGRGRHRETDEAVLIAQACAGNAAAFGRLVQRYEPSLARFSYRLIGRVDLADDLRQEALLRAFVSLPQLHNPDRFGAWLFGIAANLAKWWWRRQARWPVSLEGLVAEYPDVAWERLGPSLRLPEQVIEEAEQTRLLQEAIATLPDDLARPLVLHYLDGLSYAEIAAALDVPLSTVKGRLFKSRSQLRQTLGSAFRPTTSEPNQKARRQRRKKGAIDVLPDESHLVPVLVDRIYTAPKESNGEDIRTHIVLREEHGSRWLPIIVGEAEAIALACHQQGQRVPRPMSHDLMKTLLDAGGLHVTRVAVTRNENSTFYAAISVQQLDGTSQDIDARPSDAINLAVRTGAPIFVTEQVLQTCAVNPGA